MFLLTYILYLEFSCQNPLLSSSNKWLGFFTPFVPQTAMSIAGSLAKTPPKLAQRFLGHTDMQLCWLSLPHPVDFRPPPHSNKLFHFQDFQREPLTFSSCWICLCSFRKYIHCLALIEEHFLSAYCRRWPLFHTLSILGQTYCITKGSF